MKRRRALILLAGLIGLCVTAEFVGRRRVDPAGRASNLREYLAWRPSANRFAIVDVKGDPHLVAYGPKSSPLLLSSGPSAYVFDRAGRLVDWSPDIGDDSAFDGTWDAQRSAQRAETSSRSDAERFATTRPFRQPQP